MFQCDNEALIHVLRLLPPHPTGMKTGGNHHSIPHWGWTCLCGIHWGIKKKDSFRDENESSKLQPWNIFLLSLTTSSCHHSSSTKTVKICDTRPHHLGSLPRLGPNNGSRKIRMQLCQSTSWGFQLSHVPGNKPAAVQDRSAQCRHYRAPDTTSYEHQNLQQYIVRPLPLHNIIWQHLTLHDHLLNSFKMFPGLAHHKHLKALCQTFLAAMPLGQWTHHLQRSQKAVPRETGLPSTAWGCSMMKVGFTMWSSMKWPQSLGALQKPNQEVSGYLQNLKQMGFPKIGVPPNRWLIMENPIYKSISGWFTWFRGTPMTQETSIWATEMQIAHSPGDLSNSRGAVRGAGQSRRNDFTKSSRTWKKPMRFPIAKSMGDLTKKQGEIMEMTTSINFIQ